MFQDQASSLSQDFKEALDFFPEQGIKATSNTECSQYKHWELDTAPTSASLTESLVTT